MLTPDLTAGLGGAFQMWVTFALILAVLVLYAMDKIPVEVTSSGILAALLVFFHLAPVLDGFGGNRLDAGRLLSGFANPALITVIALLVVGQGMVRTGVLEQGARRLLELAGGRARLTLGICLTGALLISGVLNNIPVVVIFIPIMQTLAERLGVAASRVMMSLSFVAVLGGSATLIGSGSNLLVSGALLQAGETPFGFFDFTGPGLIVAGVGLAYALLVLPWVLPERESLASRIMARSGKYFLAQIAIESETGLEGAGIVGAYSKALPDMRVRMVLRAERVVMPPFHDFQLRLGDVVVVAASRRALSRATADSPGLLHPGAQELGGGMEDVWQAEERTLAEVMVVPGSRLIGRRLTMAGFQWRTRCVVLGIQRRTQMFRSRLTDVPLEAGDVLLVEGRPNSVEQLRTDSDVILMEWSTEELPLVRRAKQAVLLFTAVVLLAATGVLPIVVAGVVGALGMLVSGVLNVREAARAIDTKIVIMIPATLALGAALQETGGAAYLAHAFLVPLQGVGTMAAVSGLFLAGAILAHVIGSNAVAVLFTPIAVGMGRELGIDPHVLAVVVVFAANAGLATPIGYQTNLLVMGPGHYRFSDFLRAGGPLVVLLWITVTLVVPWWYGL